MHEVQHAIQDIEGFASGSSEEYWKSIDKQHTEKLVEISETRKEIEARGGKKLVDLSLKYLDNFEKISNNDPNSEQLQREREEIEAQARRKGCYRLLKSLSMQRIEARALEKKLALFDSDYERYYNTAGEIEARNVEKRLDMTDDEREAERPDIDRKKVAFVESKFRAAKGESLDELAESKGYSQKLYHQTGDNFTVFDTEHQDAGKYDPEMPTGTFLKPDDSDIGLSGKKQIELFTKIKNPLEFKDRADAVRFWKKNVPGYAEAVRKIDRINERYSREVARAGMEVSEYKKEWRRNNPDADNREIYNDPEFQRLDEAQDRIAREWDDRSNEASLEAKKLIDGYMVESGYDGVVMENDVGSNGKSTKTYVVFDSSQMKSTDTVTYDDNGNEIPLSARFDDSNDDIRYSMSSNTSVDEVLRRLENKEITRDEARTLLSREKTLNPAQIANATESDASTTPPRKRNQEKNEGNRQSKFYESLMGSSIFDDTFKREAADNSFIQKYKSVTNEETLKEAAEELDNGGEAYVSRWWTIDQKRASLIDTAVGFILMDRYQRVGDYESAIAAAEKVRGFGTAQGQSVQIFSILSRLTPDTMVIYAQRELTKAFDALQKKRAQKWIDENADKFNLTEDEIEYIRRRTLQAAQLPEGRDKSIRLAEIASLLQDKLPPEKGQGMKALQRVSMLLNPKTIERNIVSNLGMVPVFIASDFFGSGIDRIVSMKTGVRTTGNFDVKSAKGIVKGAWETMDDIRRHINTRNEELNRFEVGGLKLRGKAFNEHHTGKMAKQLNDCARVLNALDRFTSFCLELGDRPFYEMWYINSINNQLKLNKATEATPEMIQIACLEALQRTWQDTNKVVEAVSKLKNSVLNCVTINGYGLGDVMVKFVKTPANLTKAIVDFSPAGVVKAIAVDAKNMTEAIKKGQFEASLQKKFVDSLSKGIAGSLVYILTVALVKAGKISGAGDEDKDISNFEKYILGIPEYSINLFGKWFSYDWMQPVGAVFATVSDYMKSKEENPNSEWYENIVEAIRAGGEVLYNQSFMQSIQNLFTADNIIDGVIDSALDDPSVYVPQLVSQIANVTDEYRRVTYENGSPFKTALNKIKVKIPGWRQTLDRQVDVLGRDVPNSQHSVFNAFFNPGNTYTDTSNNIADEVYALYKRTGDATVIPRKAPYFIEKAEIKRQLTAEQTNDYQRMAGSVSSELLEVIFGSEDYAKFDDDQKIYIVTAVYDYAARCAKSQLDIYDYEWLSAMEGNKSNGEPILSETTYKKLDDKAIQMLIDENFFTKAELKCKGDTELVAKLLIKKAKARE